MSERAPGTTERSYADWYVWAKRNLSPSNENCHAAARAATFAVEGAQDPMTAARQSAVSRSGPGWESPADPWTRGYAEWFDWARLNLRTEVEGNHVAAAAVINALHAGADPASAMDAARAAVAGMSPLQPPPYSPGPPPPAPQYASPPPFAAPSPYASPAPYAVPPAPVPQNQPPQNPPPPYPAPGQGYAPQPYPQPAPPPGYGPPPAPQASFAPQGYAPQPYPQGYPTPAGYSYPMQTDASGMRRSPIRVAALLTIGNVPYYIWWMWEVMGLGIKESFPRAKSFWWTLIPIYGYVVVYRALQDQQVAEANLTGSSVLQPSLVVGLLIATGIVNRLTNQVASGIWAVITFVFGFAIIGAAGYLTQSSSNRYLDARYPGVPKKGMSIGEIVATILGLLLFGLIVLAAFSH